MKQGIEQNMTENKKPRMYVSWKIILLNSIGIVFLSHLLFFLSWLSVVPVRLEISFLISLLITILLIVIPLIISGVVEKPRGYVKTVFFDIVIFFLLVASISEILLVAPRLDCFDFCTPATPEYILMGQPLFFVGFLIAVPLILVCSIFLNHKFQKSETELGITQP